MGEAYISIDVNCPFYLDSKKPMQIKCEGIVNARSTRLFFENNNVRSEFMAKYCCKNYGNCPLYLALMKSKYPEYYAEFRRKDGCTEKTEE